jgi:hypothetical protein
MGQAKDTEETHSVALQESVDRETRSSDPLKASPYPRQEESAGARAEAARTVPSRMALEALGVIAAPGSLLVALGFYFGWVRTNEFYAYFGIDTSVLEFSTRDYLLRSPDVLFIPLGALLFTLLISLQVHWLIRRWIARGRYHDVIRWASWIALPVGTLLLCFGFVSAFATALPFRVHFLFRSLSLGLGLILLTYAAYLLDRIRRKNGQQSVFSRRQSLVSVGLVAMLVVLSLYWAGSDWARALGRGRAQQRAQQLSTEPGVILYTKHRFDFPSGVRESQLPDGSGYRYRYTGLRLLIRSGEKYVFVPANWSPVQGVAVLVPDNKDVRLGFTRGTQ